MFQETVPFIDVLAGADWGRAFALAWSFSYPLAGLAGCLALAAAALGLLCFLLSLIRRRGGSAWLHFALAGLALAVGSLGTLYRYYEYNAAAAESGVMPGDAEIAAAATRIVAPFALGVMALVANMALLVLAAIWLSVWGRPVSVQTSTGQPSTDKAT
jgi:hypothetical protein